MKKHLLILFTFIFLLSCEKEAEIMPTTKFDIEDEYYAVNEQVQITDLSEADTYYWDFGDGSTYIGKEPSHAYKEPGTYTVKLVSKIGSKENSFTREVKVGRYYAYEVQLLQFVDNYWLEGGERTAPSVGNPDIYLKITELDPYTLKTLYQSNIIANVQPKNLPLTWALEGVVLDIKPETFSFWNVGFNFYDKKTEDRLIAGTDVMPNSSRIEYDKSKNEGYFQSGWGAPESGCNLLVKFRIEFR
ncbi:PKD domain-containing protein [Pontibacter sp. 172403-2]|uniref:PKD domain-containing protein n=1 Tax=Pontibacter rufus TaxID=2791028 RepID=UPI0018AFD005|nr:PKD domain-containing protein [Pontibacter sp. 172403-2]MBF9254846.1 PKD domain-containing protein [Pontibacter sp. 172403-2]